MDWAEQLLEEYSKGRKQLKDLYKSLEKDSPKIKIINSMINDMDFVIKWLKTGQMPEKNVLYHPKGSGSYWDDDLEGYVDGAHYNNPFLEVEDCIDKELEMKKHA